MRCRNFCTRPRGARRNIVYFPVANALKKGRNGRNAEGCLARCRILGVDGRPDLRFPDDLSPKRGAKRAGVITHKRECRPPRGAVRRSFNRRSINGVT